MPRSSLASLITCRLGGLFVFQSGDRFELLVRVSAHLCPISAANELVHRHPPRVSYLPWHSQGARRGCAGRVGVPGSATWRGAVGLVALNGWRSVNRMSRSLFTCLSSTTREARLGTGRHPTPHSEVFPHGATPGFFFSVAACPLLRRAAPESRASCFETGRFGGRRPPCVATSGLRRQLT